MSIVLGNLIDGCQSVFIGGRQLLQSVIIANEIVDEANRRKKIMHFFKMDFKKAYDLVSWEFFIYMLQRMVFHEKWIDWIRGCLFLSWSSILVNGSPT